MDNPEEVMQILERFNVNRSAEITAQLEEYITFVARTGDSVYPWSLVKNLFREKLVNVITEFYNETPTKELPQYPNVDPFNYETMKKVLIEKLDSFSAAPFTIQRISELLSDPRKQYSRIDKFMRAVEKTILVVSTVPPGRHRSESENGDSLDSALNGEFASEVNVDIDMEQDGGSFAVSKETTTVVHRKEQNHDVSTVNHETISIKKSAKEEEAEETKEEEEEVKKDEPVTDVTIETVSITVIEPDGTTKESEAVAVDIPAASVVVEDATVIPEVQESAPVVEAQVVENEPIRSAENEILVDTAEIISETTPLAALENIVAIQPEPVVETPVEQVEPQVETESEAAEVPETAETPEESEIETKRLKLEEVSTPEPEKEEPEEIKPEEPEISAPEPQPTVIQEQNLEEIPPAEVTEPPAIEKIEEPLPEIAEIPIEIVPPTEPATETPTTEMETVPIVTENTMSLDEDEPPALEQEMTPIANKMDTDEVEAAPMDFEDDAEPMDQ